MGRESDDGVDDRRGRGAGANVKRALRRAQAHRRAVQDVSTSFLKCKKKDLDPSVCLNEGKAVLGCLGTVLKDLRSSCLSEVDSYSQCLDHYSNDLRKCRKEESVFDSACPKP